MSDYNSGLPIRTEADGADERVHVKIVDGTTPSQRAIVDTDGNVHTEIHGNDPGGTDRVVRTSELGALTPDGVYDASNNTKPGNAGLIAAQRAATPGDSDQIQRVTAITASDVHALDVALHDAAGLAFSASNPLPVASVDSIGTPINDYATSAAVAAAASVNHDYTVSAAVTLYADEIVAAGSGKIKLEVKLETAAASGTFVTKFVLFNSTAEPNIILPLKGLQQVTGAKVRLTITNRDLQAQDIYSTIVGYES